MDSKQAQPKVNVKAPPRGDILVIDSGVESGWAVFSRFYWSRLEPPVTTGLVCPRKDLSWEERLDASCRYYELLVRGHLPGLVLIEWPAFMESEGGTMVARTEGLVKLAAWCGAIRRTFRMLDVSVYHAKVGVWKGQTSKRIVNARIVKRLGAEACQGFKDHVWDAVGIGLWAKGYL
jgi:hypothetical protein